MTVMMTRRRARGLLTTTTTTTALALLASLLACTASPATASLVSGGVDMAIDADFGVPTCIGDALVITSVLGPSGVCVSEASDNGHVASSLYLCSWTGVTMTTYETIDCTGLGVTTSAPCENVLDTTSAGVGCQSFPAGSVIRVDSSSAPCNATAAERAATTTTSYIVLDTCVGAATYTRDSTTGAVTKATYEDLTCSGAPQSTQVVATAPAPGAPSAAPSCTDGEGSSGIAGVGVGSGGSITYADEPPTPPQDLGGNGTSSDRSPNSGGGARRSVVSVAVGLVVGAVLLSAGAE